MQVYAKFKVTGYKPNGGRLPTKHYTSWLMASAINLYKGHVWGFSEKLHKWKLLKTVWN